MFQAHYLIHNLQLWVFLSSIFNIFNFLIISYKAQKFSILVKSNLFYILLLMVLISYVRTHCQIKVYEHSALCFLLMVWLLHLDIYQFLVNFYKWCKAESQSFFCKYIYSHFRATYLKDCFSSIKLSWHASWSPDSWLCIRVVATYEHAPEKWFHRVLLRVESSSWWAGSSRVNISWRYIHDQYAHEEMLNIVHH